MFWCAPELLHTVDKDGNITKCSSEADIYAASIILKELFARNGPYTEYDDYMMPEGTVKYAHFVWVLCVQHDNILENENII